MSNDEPKVVTTAQLRAAIAQVSFERSCLDMGWQWQVTEVDAPRQLVAEAVGDGWLIRCSFQRPDRETGEIGRGFGRWWFVERETSVSGVQKTMYAAAKMIVDHELMEAFKVHGRRPFDPHRTIHELTVGADR